MQWNIAKLRDPAASNNIKVYGLPFFDVNNFVVGSGKNDIKTLLKGSFSRSIRNFHELPMPQLPPDTLNGQLN